MLDEISYESFADEPLDSLTQRVHDLFADELPERYKPRPGAAEHTVGETREGPLEESHGGRGISVPP